MSKKISAGERLLRQRVKQQVDDSELLTRKAWKNPAGPLFGKLRIFYCIAAVYSFLVFILNEFVLLQMYNSAYLKMTSEQSIFFGRNQWFVHSAFVLAIAAFVFVVCKKYRVAFVLQLFTGLLMSVQIFQVFNGIYANQTLLGTMYLFGLLPLLIVVFMLLIQIGYRYRLKTAVENEMQILYNQYGNEDGLMSAEEWDSLLENHETALLNQ